MSLLTLIDDYCEKHSTPPSRVCEELLHYTERNVPMSVMLVGGLEGSFLGFLVSLVQAKSILEIGTYTGYSALAMAERLPEDGKLITLDVNTETTGIAKEFWAKSPHGKKIESRVAPALDSLKKLQSEKQHFDLVFIDADKTNYAHYFEQSLPMLSPNGLIVFDNALQNGKVLDKENTEESVKAIRHLNDMIFQRQDLEKVLLPVRDGILLARRRRV